MDKNLEKLFFDCMITKAKIVYDDVSKAKTILRRYFMYHLRHKDFLNECKKNVVLKELFKDEVDLYGNS